MAGETLPVCQKKVGSMGGKRLCEMQCVREDAGSEGRDRGVKPVDGGEEVKDLSHHHRHNKQWERITLLLLLCFR